MDAKQILAYFQSRRDAVIDLTRQLVDIESPSNDASRSREVAGWIEGQVRATGAEIHVERIAVEPGEHVIIRSFPGDARPTLLLGHTDTVHPAGTKERNPTRIEGNRFYGCGIFDMKSGVVLMLEALRFFATTGAQPASPVTVVLSCDEEVGSMSGREIVEREAAASSACLILEPSAEGRVKTARKGTGIYTLRAHGAPAHAGLEPEKGANAIRELARQVEAIHSIARPEIGTTVNVTTFRGGTTINVIPALAECDIDVRFSVAVEAERVDRELRALSSYDTGVSLELDGSDNRPPMERTEAVAALYERAKALAASFDYELGEAQVGGGSDGNFVAALGVPVLDGLGITGAGAHTLDEHILVSDIAPRATLVTMLLFSRQ